MKDNYINDLKKELEEANVSNIDEIINKYSKRYDFGLESEMSEKEIEEMLGNPKKVAKEYSKKNENNSVKENVLKVKTVNDDVFITKSKDNDVHISSQNTTDKSYNIRNWKGEYYIVYKKGSYFSLNRKRGIITIEIPEGMVFDDVEITVQNGKIEINKPITSKNLEIGSMAGNIEANILSSDKLYLHTTSGEVNINEIHSKKLTISNISGQIIIGSVRGELIKAETLTGRIEVKDSDAKYKVSAVAGDVLISGKDVRTMKDKIKGVFVSES